MLNKYQKIRETGNGLDVVVDKETGEIKYLASAHTHVITSKRQRDAYKKAKQKELYRAIQRSKNWVACYHDPIRELSARLTIEQLGALIKLLPFMRMNHGGKLIFKGGQGMTINEIQEVINKSKRQTRDLVKALVKVGVVLRKKEGRTYIHFISEKYHTMGKTHEIPFTKLFNRFARLKLEKLTLQEAGLLYLVLPYFHKDTYLLCNNPYEIDRDLIDPMTREELAALLKMDVRTVSRYMNSLVRHGIVMRVSAYNVVNFIVHPDFMFRSDIETDYTEEVRTRFKDLRKTAEKSFDNHSKN